MTFLLFIVVAVMRVIQVNCNKRTSNLIDTSEKFFHYGAFYQLISALFGLIALCIVGFYGFDGFTIGLSLISAVLFAVELFASLEAVRGGSLVLCNMFSTGGSIFIPCIVGTLFFGDTMTYWHWIGLLVFVAAVYFIASNSEKEQKKLTLKTLLMLVLSMLSNGAIMVLQDLFGERGENVFMFSFLTFAFNAVILAVCFFALVLFFRKKDEAGRVSRKIEPLPKKLYLFGAMLALALFTISNLVTWLNKAYPPVVVFPLSSTISLIITAIVGAIAFKEKITWKKAVGIVLGVASVVVINMDGILTLLF